MSVINFQINHHLGWLVHCPYSHFFRAETMPMSSFSPSGSSQHIPRYRVCYLITELCLTLCNPMGCSPPGSSVHKSLQARIVEWVARPFSRGSSQPRDWTWVSCTDRLILYHGATWNVQVLSRCLKIRNKWGLSFLASYLCLHSTPTHSLLPSHFSALSHIQPPAQKAARSFFTCCTPARSPRWSTEPSSVKERMGGLISWLTSHRLHAFWEARALPCSICGLAPSTRLSTEHTLQTSVLTQWVHRKGLLQCIFKNIFYFSDLQKN